MPDPDRMLESRIRALHADGAAHYDSAALVYLERLLHIEESAGGDGDRRSALEVKIAAFELEFADARRRAEPCVSGHQARTLLVQGDIDGALLSSASQAVRRRAPADSDLLARAVHAWGHAHERVKRAQSVFRARQPVSDELGLYNPLAIASRVMVDLLESAPHYAETLLWVLEDLGNIPAADVAKPAAGRVRTHARKVPSPSTHSASSEKSKETSKRVPDGED